MTCRTAEELVLEMLDGRLTTEQQAELESHLVECQACRVFREVQVALDLALADSQVVPPLSPTFGVHLSQRIKAEKRRILWQWLPDVFHLGGGLLATAVCVACLPVAPALTLAAGAALTLGTYSLQTVFRFWLEELEDL